MQLKRKPLQVKENDLKTIKTYGEDHAGTWETINITKAP